MEKKEAEALALLMIPVQIVLAGLVLSVTWGWFLVPLGVMSIGIPHAAGLYFSARWISSRMIEPKKDRTPQEIINGKMGDLLIPLFVLGVGAICKAAM